MGTSIRARFEGYVRSLAPPPAAGRDQVYPAIAELLRRSERDGAPVSLDLTPYELKVFSQNGEDGVLDEILRRVGTQSRTFAEFGAGPGTEAVCVYLADVARWHGHFIESDPELYRSLAAKYESNDLVTATEALVTPPTVEELFSRIGVPDALDVLCIDIDGHDYWVWKALDRWRPRVVVVEYNAHLGTRSLTMPMSADPAWDHTDHFGASIAALSKLGSQKGYRLVHCDLTGVNAFFVREDLGGDLPAPEQVALRAPNYFLRGLRLPPGEGKWQDV